VVLWRRKEAATSDDFADTLFAVLFDIHRELTRIRELLEEDDEEQEAE
jgi:hypothetical protein